MSPSAQPDPFATPRDGQPSGPATRWVHVPGVVEGVRAFGVGGWNIRYPLPDGSSAYVHAVLTQPSVLREGMTVPVLVDADNPRNARLDLPAHTRRRNLILLAVAGFLAVTIAVPAFFLLLFALVT